MKHRLIVVVMTAASLTACNEDKGSSQSQAGASDNVGRSYSVFGSIKPKVDPSMVEKVKQEEIEAAQARQKEMERQLAMQQQQADGSYVDPSQRNLPSVNTDPISGSLQPSSEAASSQPQTDPSAWTPPAANNPSPPPQQVASSYGSNYGSPSPGFVPPPPSVSLSTSAQVAPFGSPPPPPEMYGNPYAAYMNPYANPYAQAPPAAQPVEKPKRPALFGSGDRREESSEDDDSAARKAKKEKSFVVITPTGMEPRSPYKQRDDLKALWKGALASSLGGLAREEKFAEQLNKVDIALPTESTRGSLSMQPRTIDALFKTGAMDKKIAAPVKKTQSELAQAYYRYLYSYNKFSLTQQTVAARKQEAEFAESPAEKQRAAADLAQAQSDAEASKEDMRAAQTDLASIAGASAARTVIGRVCGVSPSIESLQIAVGSQEPEAKAQSPGGGTLGGLFSAFGFGGKPKEAAPEKVASKSEDKKDDDKKDKKDKKKEKGDKGGRQIASLPSPKETSAPSSRSTAVESAAVSPAPAQSGGIRFELRDVKTTPRKSILRVSIRNAGGDNFSFDTEAVSVAEGNTRLADASVRAEFDSTIVQPNQEVSGTITIFGRPWNDKLTVSLSDGGKTITLHK